MNRHFILDAETIGQSIFTCPVVNISYLLFDWDRFTSEDPYTFEELVESIQTINLNIKEQIEEGKKFKKKDLQFWEDQGQAALNQLLHPNRGHSVKSAVQEFTKYLTNKTPAYWWSRSNAFDPLLVQRMFEEASSKEAFDELLPFWAVRDVRTYLDTRFDFKLKRNSFCPIDDEAKWDRIFIKHNSAHDVAADVLRMQRVERLLQE